MIGEHARLVLVVTGALTVGAVVAVLAPDLTLRLLFGGDTADGRTALVTRHWGTLLTLVGAALIYAAYHPEVRGTIMVVAVAEKFAIGALIFLSPFRTRPLALTVAVADTVMAAIYLALLSQPGV